MTSSPYFEVVETPSKNAKTEKSYFFGKSGKSCCVMGQTESGEWTVVKWLFAKEDVCLDENGKFFSENPMITMILSALNEKMDHEEGDRFLVREHQSLMPKSPDMYFENYAEYKQYREGK